MSIIILSLAVFDIMLQVQRHAVQVLPSIFDWAGALWPKHSLIHVHYYSNTILRFAASLALVLHLLACYLKRVKLQLVSLDKQYQPKLLKSLAMSSVPLSKTFNKGADRAKSYIVVFKLHPETLPEISTFKYSKPYLIHMNSLTKIDSPL